ncbi:MAG: signal peptidase I, partial [Spirochaetales bacterium]|nr:signal peptidase I [Spirochaetales bacterium]
MENWITTVQDVTEKILTYRKRKKLKQKKKQQAKNPILDWLEAFIWAAGVVLLINQYLFQAYQIPSGSMIDTLLIKDHIFVNKIIFGPELIPGKFKIPSTIKPERNDVMIFE